MHLEDYRLFDTKVFRDVVHDYIRVEYMPIWKLINTKEFQRLRRIKQLGGTSMVFPSAEHSRFVHSLGVYEITRQMTELDQVKNHLTDYERLTVLCAALLHDLGHGPFSHSFEGIFHYNHEEMTTALIRGHTEVHDVLSQIDPHLPEDVARIIEKKADKPMLVQMISSQVDADRMDYLLRDSYNCGVTYGQFDLSRILRTMRIVDNRIVFKSSGVQAIEDYILARYYMYWQVYYHPVSRSYEQVLGSVMKRVKSLYMDSLCSHHAEIQYLYLIYTVYNVIILPFHSCKKKREPFTALFHIDFLIHLSYLTVWQPMSLNFFPKMGQSLVLHQMPSQLLSFAHILLQIPMQIHNSKHLSE